MSYPRTFSFYKLHMFVHELERFVYFFMDQHTHVRMCMHMPGYALEILLCLRPSVQRQFQGLQLRTNPYLRYTG